MKRYRLLSICCIGLALLAACGPQVSPTAMRPPTSMPRTDTAQTPAADPFARPGMSVQGQLANGVSFGTTSNGYYFKGDPNAPVILFEFSDFQWPYCGQYVRETLPQLAKDYIVPGKLLYIFVNFPLTSIHPNAEFAAEAAACAGAQGKFWEMHDQLYLNQADWTSSDGPLNVFLNYGQLLDLDPVAFRTCLGNHQMAERVQSDMAFGNSVNVPSTPAFVINGKGMIGAQSYTAFQQVIDAALKAAQP